MSGLSSVVRSTANASAATAGSSSRARTHPVTTSCASLPVPQKSSGFTGGRPGSSSSAIRAVVSSEIVASGTPTDAAESMSSARSPPESCTLASAPGPARRPDANSASASAISSRLSTRNTPKASNSASYAPSSPASAPECASTILPRERLAPDLQRDDRHVALLRGPNRVDEARRVADRLDEQADDLRALEPERVREVVGDGRHELLPGRDGQVQAEVPAVVDDGAERRPRVGDERDPADPHVLRLVEAERAHALLEVREAHPVAAADGHPGLARDRRQALEERRNPVDRLLVPAREDHGGSGADRRRQPELLLEPRVRNRQDREVDRLVEIRQRRHAREPEDLVVLRVHGVDDAVEAALDQLDEALMPDRSLADARADDGDRPRLEHALERRARVLRGHAGEATSSSRPLGPSWPGGTPATRGSRRRRRRRASRSSRGRAP